MSDLPTAFAKLEEIMRPYASKLAVDTDTTTDLYLNTHHIQKNKKPLFFGAVQMKKNYVSFHLMPVYVQPALLNGITPQLKKHMQGKSCFNFSVVDEQLFRELAALTKAGYASYKEQGFV